MLLFFFIRVRRDEDYFIIIIIIIIILSWLCWAFVVACGLLISGYGLELRFSGCCAGA